MCTHYRVSTRLHAPLHGLGQDLQQAWGESRDEDITAASHQIVDDSPLVATCSILNLLVQGSHRRSEVYSPRDLSNNLKDGGEIANTMLVASVLQDR
jgi:hypothetical protein